MIRKKFVWVYSFFVEASLNFRKIIENLRGWRRIVGYVRDLFIGKLHTIITI